MPNYWIVGATVDNQDMTDSFVNHGFWFANAPGAQEDIQQIQPGDRMAIKSRLGYAAKEVVIKALGIVEEVTNYPALPYRMIYVKWVRIEPKKVPGQGFLQTIHGPYTEAKAHELQGDIFRL